jgi:hypothetical protein
MKASSNGGIAAQSGHWLLAFSLIFLSLIPQLASADDSKDKAFAQRAEAAFQQARSQYRSQPNDPVAAWQFGRTCYDWADFATSRSGRADIANQGIAACQHSLTLTNSSAAHYYQGLNLGQLAQSETLGGLKIVHEMVHEFSTAIEIDPHFDFAGPERSLGLLYRDCPGWPISIGNRVKARKCLEDAAQMAPNDPENILNLAETYLKWGEVPDAKKQLSAVDALWPKAKKELTGPAWDRDWDDWTNRREALREKLTSN